MKVISTLKSLAAASAILVANSAFAADYVTPNGDGGSQSNSYVETILTKGAVHDIYITHTQKNGVNYELCDEDEIEVNPGTPLAFYLYAKYANENPNVVPSPQDLRYCVAYIFTDWDCDGTFEEEARYGKFASEAGFAGNIAANYNEVLTIQHVMNIPEDAVVGKSRIRVIYTEAWDGKAQSGDMNGNYQYIHKGYSYDFLVNCTKPAAIDNIAAEENNAPVEYFNLQGVRVNADNLTPGLYISRQGNETKKVLINK